MLNFFPKIRPLAVISAIAVAAISVAPLVAQAANPTEATFSGSGVRSHGVPIINAQGSTGHDGSTNQSENSDQNVGSNQPSIKLDDVAAESNWQKNQQQVGSRATTGTVSNPISFHKGGAVYSGNVAIYPVWVGTWTATRQTLWNSVLSNLVTVLGASTSNTTMANQVFATNASYFTSQAIAAPSLNWPQAAAPSAPLVANGNISDAQVATYISAAIKTGAVPAPAATGGLRPIYVFIGANNTLLSSGFGTKYCGWHSYGTISGTTTPYIAIQDFTSKFLSACASQSPISPNGDAYVDAMASVLVHEIDETLSDPLLNAWYDARGSENADKCAWTFGTTSTTGGYKYNITEGGRKYLIQRNWLSSNVNKGDGTACTLADAL